ncbi:MAG: Spore photoproduct lyase, partial [uncultured Solirubrobacteraceae bacterium]
ARRRDTRHPARAPPGDRHDLRRARRDGAPARARGARPVPAGQRRRGPVALADPRPARQRRQRRRLERDQAHAARSRHAEGAAPAAQRPFERLHRTVAVQRLRDELCVLLRPAAQGLRQPDHGVREHRADPARDRAPRCTPGTQADCEPVRSRRLGLRHRRELRLLGRRVGVRQRARPRRPVRADRRREGVLCDEGGQPRPARARPAGRHPRALLAHAARSVAAGRRAHASGQAPHRRDRRLRRGRLRGARQPLAGHRRRRLARRLGRAAHRARRRREQPREGADGRRDHLSDAQRPAARGQPRLAPARRGAALDAHDAGAEAIADRRLERALPAWVEGGASAGAARPDRAPHALAARALRVL